jgi:hypothetical protein
VPAVAIDVDERPGERRRERAERPCQSPEVIVAELIREAIGGDVDPEFRALTASIVSGYRPVLTRLGQ